MTKCYAQQEQEDAAFNIHYSKDSLTLPVELKPKKFKKGLAVVRISVDTKGIKKGFSIMKLSLASKNPSECIEYSQGEIGILPFKNYPSNIRPYYSLLEKYVRTVTFTKRKSKVPLPTNNYLLLVRFK